MATVSIAKASVSAIGPNIGGAEIKTFLWETLTTTNRDGEGLRLNGNVIAICVQAKGTFGASASIGIEGSLDDGTTWSSMADLSGGAISMTAAGLKNVGDYAPEIRAYLTDGDGSTDVDVYVSVWMT